MKYCSTRGGDGVSLEAALLGGIAPDGGLFVPEPMPEFAESDFNSSATLAEIAEHYLRPFFADSVLLDELPGILAETFSFPIPVSILPQPSGYAGLLELYHGPTSAFKDVGAGFLAACISRLDSAAERPLTILVATSGDTGGAVAAAFDRRPGVRVVVLYPRGRVSARQEKQLTCWSDNVISLAVEGSFDDCQALVKQAMADADLKERYRLSSANSINIGRLLPQSIYYAVTSLEHFRNTGRRPSFIVPTGNLGNGLACIMARAAGMPISQIVLTTNANCLIGDYLGGAEWLPRQSSQTLASAMDVGNPSNMERLRNLFGEADALAGQISAVSVSDAQIEQEVRQFHEQYSRAICPHTATAAFVYRSLDVERRSTQDWIIVSTAHPAKFEAIVEPLIGEAVDLPDSLADILSRESRFTIIQPNLEALVERLD